MAGGMRALFGSKRSALLTMEMQRGVVGDLSNIGELAAAARRDGVIDNTARLAAAARKHGVPVVHCTAGFSSDRGGSPQNAPLIRALLKNPAHLLEGTRSVDLVPEIGPAPGDLLSHRRHGVAPFTGTELHSMLQVLGVGTIVAAGVSLNLGMIGLAVEAVGLGYDVVLATDAVCGVPAQYAQEVMRYTLALVATLATTDEIIRAW